MARSIGAHVSAAGGIDKAVGRATEIGCNSVQIFSGSPRVWKKLPLEDQPLEAFATARKEQNLQKVFTHALYLVNIASDKEALLRKSHDTLAYELRFDAAIHGDGVVVHLGSHQGRGWDAVKQQIVSELVRLIDAAPENSCFLIENSAGQNGKIASDLAEIRYLLDAVEAECGAVSSGRLGWCFDTCHAFAAGYVLSDSPEQFLQTVEETGKLFSDDDAQVKSAPREITRLDLWDTLKCIHVNDSRDPFASGRDRHENLGDGSIPKAHFEHFLNRPEVLSLPLVLEVPGISGGGPDAENVTRLKKMLID